MWAHYSEKHKGVCLEFDARNPTVGGAYRVTYKRELLLQILLDKSSVWEYEDECRVVAHEGQISGAAPQFLPLTNRSYLSLPGALTAVIVGCRAEFGDIKAFVARHTHPAFRSRASLGPRASTGYPSWISLGGSWWPPSRKPV
jgi:hypothetical protein